MNTSQQKGRAEKAKKSKRKCNPDDVSFEYGIVVRISPKTGGSLVCSNAEKAQIKRALNRAFQKSTRALIMMKLIHSSKNKIFDDRRLGTLVLIQEEKNHTNTSHSNKHSAAGPLECISGPTPGCSKVANDTKSLFSLADDAEMDNIRSLARFGSGFQLRGIGRCRGCSDENRDARRFLSDRFNFFRFIIEPMLSRQCTRALNKFENKDGHCLEGKGAIATVQLNYLGQLSDGSSED